LTNERPDRYNFPNFGPERAYFFHPLAVQYFDGLVRELRKWKFLQKTWDFYQQSRKNLKEKNMFRLIYEKFQDLIKTLTIFSKIRRVQTSVQNKFFK